jgi:HEAT repeat protein
MAALKDEDKTVREFAAGAFRDIKDPSAVDVLVSALNDHENSVQCQAAYALADIRDTSVIDPLVSELKKGGDNYYVAYVLGSIGQPAVGSLINGLRGKGDLARFGAIQGLEKAKDMQTVEPLINALGDQDETIKKFANEALKKITGKDFEGNQKAWQIWWEQNKKGK